jgi:hypothetical protein
MYAVIEGKLLFCIVRVEKKSDLLVQPAAAKNIPLAKKLQTSTCNDSFHNLFLILKGVGSDVLTVYFAALFMLQTLFASEILCATVLVKYIVRMLK